MPGLIFNVALGCGNELHNRVANGDPEDAGLVLVLLKTVESDANLRDHATLQTLLAAAGNEECDFTNYARKVLTDADIDPSVVDNAGNRRYSSISDQVWLSAGGATNNSIVRLLVCYDPDTTGGGDSEIVPISSHVFEKETDGNDLTAFVDPSGYFWADNPVA